MCIAARVASDTCTTGASSAPAKARSVEETRPRTTSGSAECSRRRRVRPRETAVAIPKSHRYPLLLAMLSVRVASRSIREVGWAAVDTGMISATSLSAAAMRAIIPDQARASSKRQGVTTAILIRSWPVSTSLAPGITRRLRTAQGEPVSRLPRSEKGALIQDSRRGRIDADSSERPCEFLAAALSG